MARNQMPIVMERALAQKDWYLFFTNLYTAVIDGMPQPPEQMTIGVSPAVYTAVIRGQAHIGGGTVSAIEFSRDGTTWFNVGVTSGFIQMDTADSIRITYTILPTLTYFPM